MPALQKHQILRKVSIEKRTVDFPLRFDFHYFLCVEFGI